MKIKQCLSLVLVLNFIPLTSEVFRPSAAIAQRVSDSFFGAPTVCKRGNMTDGVVKWRFVTHQYGRNYYRVQELHGSRWNNVSCFENERSHIVTGHWSSALNKCLIAAGLDALGRKKPRETVAAPGKRIPGRGRVVNVRRAGLACFVSIIGF